MVASDIRIPRARFTLASRHGSTVAIAVISAVGVAAFFYPFITAGAAQGTEAQAHAGDAPLIFGTLAALAGVLFVVELASQGMNAKVASVLAVLATAAAALRIVPLPAGATAFFFLIILSGYVFGPRFGMLLGALALFVSAFAVGGFGPWVPFQMFASAWIGMTAGWLGGMRHVLAGRPRIEVALLALFGGAWGFAYGALMNLWFWPYIATGENVSWAPGLGFVETLRHYWAFYVLTSFGWDAWTALGNVVLIAVAGRSVLRVLLRFRDRFTVQWRSL